MAVNPLLPLLLFATASLAMNNPFRLGYASVSAGNWDSYPAGNYENRQTYATLPAVDAYFSLWKLSGHLGLSLNYTHDKLFEASRYTPGKGRFSLGYKWGALRLRTGLDFPLGYDWSVENYRVNEVFVGSGNIDGLIGMNFAFPMLTNLKTVGISMDMQASTALNSALADRGSWHSFSYVGIDWRTHPRFKLGASLMLMTDYWIWIPTYWEGDREFKLTLAPSVGGDLKLAHKTSLGMRIGHSVYSLKRLEQREEWQRVPGERALFYSVSLGQAF